MQKTIKDAREFSDKALTSSMVIDNALTELKEYDVPALSAKLDKLEYCFNILNSIYVPELPEIKAVPKVRSINIYNPKIPELRLPRISDIRNKLPKIPNLAPLAEEIRVLKTNVCPTCGRSFEC